MYPQLGSCGTSFNYVGCNEKIVSAHSRTDALRGVVEDDGEAEEERSDVEEDTQNDETENICDATYNEFTHLGQGVRAEGAKTK